MGRELANKTDLPSGVHYDGKNQNVVVSDESVDRIATAVEHIVSNAFQWADHNPHEFYAFLFFLGFAAVLRYLAKIQVGRWRVEYDNERSISKSKHSANQLAE